MPTTAFDTWTNGHVTLARGDRFRASGGTYYRLRDGRRVSMADPGPFTFVAYHERDGRRWIVARSPEGYSTLNVGEPYESEVCPGMVHRTCRIKPLFPNQGEREMTKRTKTTKAAAPKASTKKARTKPAATTGGSKPTKARKPKSSKEAGEKKLSAIDAAAKVLADAGEPMNAKAMIEVMATKGLWTSPGGKTPHATLYSAILREIATKGKEARFKKTDRGHFAAAG